MCALGAALLVSHFHLGLDCVPEKPKLFPEKQKQINKQTKQNKLPTALPTQKTQLLHLYLTAAHTHTHTKPIKNKT